MEKTNRLLVDQAQGSAKGLCVQQVKIDHVSVHELAVRLYCTFSSAGRSDRDPVNQNGVPPSDFLLDFSSAQGKFETGILST